jgi:hypothetical protein
VTTQAACQTLQHVSKLVAFGAVGFAFRDWLLPLAALSLTAIAGTWLGTHLLARVREEDFRALYTGVLTVIALRLVEVEALALRRVGHGERGAPGSRGDRAGVAPGGLAGEARPPRADSRGGGRRRGRRGPAADVLEGRRARP